MKRILFISIILIILVLAISYYNNNNPKIILSRLIKEGNFKPGELRYKINFLGIIPAGEAVFEAGRIDEYNGKKYYHLNASAWSLKRFSKIFSAYAVLESYVDMKRMNPVVFKQELEISGKQHVSLEIIYDQENNVMLRGGVKRQILPNTQDPLSAMLNLRRMDFDTIRNFEININGSKTNYLLKGTANPKDILINKRSYKVILVDAKIRRSDKKNLYHQSSISMVLLKEKENIPILIKVFAGGVFINVELVDIKS
jgi:hypothetical protein